ncbi:transcriptional regulator, MerR family protein [Flavobacterium limnosediminis JC2902]|uniref:Transcriptional regulator, MerR family protein n=1 Tax=Flavobacterium limnosediminis JC2902 TaxID=1341181 RepID=V6SKR2_9FLAO|nr:MerR family transcriptional regulator [Flavobacterium limnosediminis]ESU27039.1 transcriptional regulator, MerR family protein [Flavobacterium limnosediminis JC2902]
MNVIKSIFSIKDLENLSGIKAHTIRIWEKRYAILEPMRTDTNIRSYDIANLQKLLNICLLLQHGYKISKLANLDSAKIAALVNEIASEKNAKNHALNSFKMAMMNFDSAMFFKNYNDLLKEKSFREVFHEVFIPLLEELGLLWQTETISPAHEHFISYLIKQKLLINTEKLQSLEKKQQDKLFVLYLPPNEIHELGLLYLNYEILYRGYKTIYLGPSIPISSLLEVKKHFQKITFVSYITVEPSPEEINQYLVDVNTALLNDTDTNLWLFGRLTEHIESKNISPKTTIYKSFEELTKEIIL